MTRETKIGLLTGLGVIILIGVLLSQYLGGPSSAPHAADLSSLGDTYRQRQLQPVGVDPAVQPQNTMLAGIDNQTPGTSPSGMDPLVARLPTRDGISSASTPATPVTLPPLVADPVSPQPAGPVLAGASSDPQSMSPVQIGSSPSNNGLERAIYVPVDPSNPSPTASQPLQGSAAANDVPTGTFYLIAKGDTLTSISKHFYKVASKANFARIIAANPALLKDETTGLQVGKKLLIPDAPKPVVTMPAVVAAPAAPATPLPDTLVLRPDTGQPAMPAIDPASSHTPAIPTHTVASAPTVYTVQSGDTLGKIARKFLGSSSNATIKRIVSANKLQDPDDLEIGMTLRIPSKPAS